MSALIAFYRVAILTGIFAVGGSILGGTIHEQPGVYTDALVLGVLGVARSGWVAVRFKLIEPSAKRMATIGGVVGFLPGARKGP